MGVTIDGLVFVLFSGTVHGAPQSEATTCECWPCGYIGRKISQYSYLCPGFFPWVKAGTATHESGKISLYL